MGENEVDRTPLPPESDLANTIVTVSELIDSTFGDPDANTVHHKQLQTVLYLLARQLRLLERKVTVKLKPGFLPRRHSSSSITITEVKLHLGKAGAGVQSDKKGQRNTKGKDEQAASSVPTSSDKSSSKATSEVDKQLTKFKTGDFGGGGKASSGGGTSDKTSTGATTRDKTSTDATTKDKASTGVTTRDTTSSDLTKSDKGLSGAKTTTAGNSIDDDDIADFTPTAEKSRKLKSGDKKSDIEDDSAIYETSKSSKTLSGDKSSSGDKSTRDNKSAGGLKSSPDDQSSSDRGKGASTAKTSDTGRSGRTTATDEASVAGDDASSEKIGIEKTASGRTLSGKSTTDKSGKSTTGKSSRQSKLLRPSVAETRGVKLDPQDYQRILEEVEVMRERELRVIRQRADSRETREKTPTPIASMESVEATFEKLLVVERLPAEEAAARAAKTKSGHGVAAKVSVVTLEQFNSLASIVQQLQDKLRPIGASAFPENIELMQELRKGASLTDAMAALQLSARLEATEKTLTNLLSLVTDMATQMPEFQSSEANKDEIEVIFGAGAKDGKKGKGVKEVTKESKYSAEKDLADVGVSPIMGTVSMGVSVDKAGADDTEVMQGDIVMYEELENKLKDFEIEIMKQVKTITDRSIASARGTKNLVAGLELKIDNALALGTRMNDLENLIANYADQINILDTGLSSQLTNYQEELTQMQHDLETGLENMAEVLANTGGDATAVAELNGHFNDLQIDIDDTIQRQNDLRQIQHGLSMDLDGLRRQIEMLRDAKSDRDEVADALRDKAGLSDLNGLVSIVQFEAVIGDLEKRLGAAYDKFNNQEIVWQKAIDEVLRELNEKADLIQVENLREQIANYLDMMRKRIQNIEDIVGEPVAAALVRKINRDGACLSCSAPAHMEIEQSTMPNLPAMKAHGADAAKGDGDHRVCYPGLPIRHPVDPRAHICHRWCGGSHTKIDVTQTRIPPSFTITPLKREIGLAKGTDGKMYLVDKERDPCSQCLPHVPPSPQVVTPSASEHAEGVEYQNVELTEFESLELLPVMSGAVAEEDENATPPIIDLQSSLCLK